MRGNGFTEVAPREVAGLLDTHAHFTESFRPANICARVRHLLLIGEAFIDKMDCWYRFNLTSTGLISREEEIRNNGRRELRALERTKESATRFALESLVKVSFGQGKVFIPVLLEDWKQLVDSGTEYEEGTKYAVKEAKDYAARNKKSNDSYRKSGIEEGGGYFRPVVSKVRVFS